MAVLETLTLTRQSAPKIWSIPNMLNALLDEKKQNQIKQNKTHHKQIDMWWKIITERISLSKCKIRLLKSKEIEIEFGESKVFLYFSNCFSGHL